MRPRLTLITAISGFSCLEIAIPAQAPETIQLSMAAEFIGGGPFPAANSRWLAVVREGSATFAIETTVEVEQIPHGCTGSATGVKAKDADAPMFMVRGARQVVNEVATFLVFGC